MFKERIRQQWLNPEGSRWVKRCPQPHWRTTWRELTPPLTCVALGWWTCPSLPSSRRRHKSTSTRRKKVQVTADGALALLETIGEGTHRCEHGVREWKSSPMWYEKYTSFENAMPRVSWRTIWNGMTGLWTKSLHFSSLWTHFFPPCKFLYPTEVNSRETCMLPSSLKHYYIC